ncbi:MAG: hypothetical protein ACLFV7_02655 [Phycisphaerae bacterium]
MDRCRLFLLPLGMLAVLFVAGGCDSAPGDITAARWEDVSAARTDDAGFAWPRYAASDSAVRSLDEGVSLKTLWNDRGLYAQFIPAPTRSTVLNVLHTNQQGRLSHARVVIEPVEGGMDIRGERLASGETRTWDPMTRRDEYRTQVTDRGVDVFVDWAALGLVGPPEDRVWIVVDVTPSDAADAGGAQPTRLFIDKSGGGSGGKHTAKCPYCER